VRERQNRFAPAGEKSPPLPSTNCCSGLPSAKRDEDTLTSLAGRLARLDRELDPSQRAQVTEIAGGKTLAQMSATLLRAIDPDAIAERATGKSGASPNEAAAEKFEEAKKQMILEACFPFDKPALREALVKLKQQNEQTIDTVTADGRHASGLRCRRKGQGREPARILP